MQINFIGEHVRTRGWNYDQTKWVIATIHEIVTGHKGLQYRVEDANGDSKYLCKSDFEIVKNVPGVGWISIPAYKEMQKLVDGVNAGEYVFNNWVFNQYFIPAVAAHLRKIGRTEEAEAIKTYAISELVWTFENGRLQAVQHRNADVRSGVYFTGGQEFHGEAAWETIRDMCLPVVMQYR